MSWVLLLSSTVTASPHLGAAPWAGTPPGPPHTSSGTVHPLAPARPLPTGRRGPRQLKSSHSSEVSVFGPTRITRTLRWSNAYEADFDVPAWIVEPFLLQVTNGDTSGKKRVWRGRIELNGQTVVDARDLRQAKPTHKTDVTLKPSNQLRTVLPWLDFGSFVEVRISGLNADQTAPTVSCALPVPGSSSADTTPDILVRYQDDPGVGEPAASGIAKSSLAVFLDEQEITSILRVGDTEASGTLPDGLTLAPGPHTLRARVLDQAGNTGETRATFAVDSSAPSIAVTYPAPGAAIATGMPELRVGYGHPIGIDPTSFRAWVDGVDRSALFTVGASEAIAQLAGAAALEDGPHSVLAQIESQTGTSATAGLEFVVDTGLPIVTFLEPADGGSVSGDSVDVTLQVDDASPVTVSVEGIEAVPQGPGFVAYQVPIGPGAEIVLHAEARDRAGNVGTATATLSSDAQLPHTTFTGPIDGAHVQTSWLEVSGLVDEAPVAQVRVNGVLASLTPASDGSQTLFSAQVPLVEGLNRLEALAVDAAANVGPPASIQVTLDRVAPRIALEAPAGVPAGQSFGVAGTASDTIGVSEVRFGIDGVILARVTQPPYEATLEPPPGALAGQALEVSAEAFDRAGNSARTSREVLLLADGIVVGQVLSDLTGLPLADASAVGGGSAAQTDPNGLYALAASGTPVMLEIGRTGMTSVWREVALEAGVGSLAADARLTPLEPPSELGPAGGDLEAETEGHTLRLSVAPGLLASGQTLQLTPLSHQGIPALLPVGYSPLAAFDLRSSLPLTVPLALEISDLPLEPLVLVSFSAERRGWTVVEEQVLPAGGTASMSIPAVGPYAVVLADGHPAMPAPVEGALLVGLEPGEDTSGALAGRTRVSPPSLPSTGGVATVQVETDASFLSGTLLSTEISEHYTLSSGRVASSELRRQDLILYRRATDGGLEARLPVSPTRTYPASELSEGNLHVEVLPDRESSWGSVGGKTPLTLTSEGLTLTVPADALEKNTAISFVRSALPSSPMVPSALVPLAAGTLRFVGPSLSASATLTLAGPEVEAGGFLLARLERVDGVPFLTWVANAVVQDGVIVSQPDAALPGIDRPGLYVLYHLAEPPGFVRGSVSGAGDNQTALIEGDGDLPFVSWTASDRTFAIPVQPGGETTLRARIPDTALAASGEVRLEPGAEARLDLSLTRTVTFLSPPVASGSSGVSVGAQLMLQASAPLQSGSVTPENVRLSVSGSSTFAASRLLLSPDARSLTVVPEQQLTPDSRYELSVRGLLDGYGEPVAPLELSFSTQTAVPLAIDPELLTFSLPDSQGMVRFQAPPGAYPAGTLIMITNLGNGTVLSLTTDNDGAVEGTLQARIQDLLSVSLTDPQRRTASFLKSQYEGSDGTTAIGTAGGSVREDSGLELRIPEDALGQAATFKIEPLEESDFSSLPDLPGAHFGGGMKISSADTPTFGREVDLVFPLPPEVAAETSRLGLRLEDAFFYIYRQITARNVGNTPEKTVFEVLDYAVLEEDGGEHRVVSASYPFSGYRNSTGSLSWYMSPSGQTLTSPLASPTLDSMMMLVWSANELAPGVALSGAITGLVRRIKWVPGQVDPEYEPVAGVPVSGVDASGAPLFQNPDPAAADTIAFTQEDGRFTLFDPSFQGGFVQVSAVDESGEVRTATAYEVNQLDTDITTDPALASLAASRAFSHVATANITFPPATSADESAAGIDIFVLEQDAYGSRALSSGTVTVGTPLLIGFRTDYANTKLPVERVELTGGAELVAGTINDAAPPGEPLWMDFLMLGPLEQGGYFIPERAGTTVITAAGRPPGGGSAVTSSLTFRVIAAGGGMETLHDQPPAVISAQVLPHDGATRVPLDVHVQVAFTEPVSQVPGNVVLREAGGVPVPVSIAGVGPAGTIPGVTSGDVVSTITLQPTSSLKLGTLYELEVSAGVQDLDRDAEGVSKPKGLSPAPFRSRFTTFAPRVLTPPGGLEDALAAGIAANLERAFLAESLHDPGTGAALQIGTLRVYDVGDPTSPIEIDAARVSLDFPPRDIRAITDYSQPDRLATLVGVVTDHRTWFETRGGPAAYWERLASTPANLLLYRLIDDVPSWIGGVSLTGSLSEGTPERLVLRDRYAYVATNGQGIQVVDLALVNALFEAAGAQTASRELATEGTGFAREAVVGTIPVRDSGGSSVLLSDLEIEDFVIDGMSQPVAFAAGTRPGYTLITANPQTLEVLSGGPLRTETGQLWERISYAAALALGRLDDRRLAVVGGYNTVGGSTLAVVDVTSPSNPIILGELDLSHAIGDIELDGVRAIVSEHRPGASDSVATFIDLTMPETPIELGVVTGVGSRIDLTQKPLLFSTERSFIRGESPLGGVRIADIAPECLLLDLRTPTVIFQATVDPLNQQHSGRFCGQERQIEFTLCEAAMVSLEGDSLSAPLVGWVDPDFTCAQERPAPTEIRSEALSAGRHVIVLPFQENMVAPFVSTPDRDPTRLFSLRAANLADPTHTDQASGKLVRRIISHPVLPVGHNFVKGVDVHDGHLVRQTVDLELPGRNLSLRLGRTYSSTGMPSEESVMGVGWAWNLGGTVVENYECGEVTVVTGDGGTIRFRTTDWETFTPEKGHHGRLTATGLGIYDLYDKAANHYRFIDLSARENRACPADFRLEYVEEPHGDRIVPYYDGLDRIYRVAEVHAGKAVKSMDIGYSRDGQGFSRVARVDALGLTVRYTYDDFGNLKTVTRTGSPATLSGEQTSLEACSVRDDDAGSPTNTQASDWTERFEYFTQDSTYPHHLKAAIDPDGRRVEYVYYSLDQTVPGEDSMGFPKAELIWKVLEYPAKDSAQNGAPVSTIFQYDFQRGDDGEHSTTVIDGRSLQTRYVLSSFGAVMERHAPMGATTLIEWAPDDVLKTGERDPEGRWTTFAYDENANLIEERIKTSDFGDVVTKYRYHPVFNVPTWKQDAEGRITTYDIDAATGDLLSETDAVGNKTKYAYDEHGQLLRITDPRGHLTTHGDHDGFGNPAKVTTPIGTSFRLHDSRGNRRLICDTNGHYSRTELDSMDRPILVVQVAGGESDDQVLRTSYTAGGAVRALSRVVSPTTRSQTIVEQDGMGRITRVTEESTSSNDSTRLTIEYTYDENGNVVRTKDRRGVVKRIDYDALNRASDVTLESGPDTEEGPIGQLSHSEYDLVGNLKSETDTRSNLTTRVEVDGLYNIRKRYLPLEPYVESFIYDRVGNLRSRTDADQNTLTYEYDGLDRVIVARNALGHALETEYLDPEGSRVNVHLVRDVVKGSLTEFEFDAADRLVRRRSTLPGKGSAGEEYVTEIAWLDAERLVITTQYQAPDLFVFKTVSRLDGLDREIESIIDPDGLSISTTRSFNGLGLVKEQTSPERDTTQMIHDGFGRIVEVIDPLLNRSSFSYDGEGAKIREVDRRGITRTFTYDNLGRKRTVSLDPRITGVPWSEQWTYHDADRIVEYQDARGFSRTMQYDALGREILLRDPLGHESRNTWDGIDLRSTQDAHGHVQAFDYDSMGRRIRSTPPPPYESEAEEICYDDATNRQFQRSRPGAVSISQMDPLGRLRARVHANTSLETLLDGDQCAPQVLDLCVKANDSACITLAQITYDATGKPVTHTDAEGRLSRQSYDGAGRRTTTTIGAGTSDETTIHYAYDRNGNLTEVRDARDLQVESESGRRVSSARMDYDALGRPVARTDGEGNTVRTEYDPEGNRILVQPPTGLATRYAWGELGELLCVVQADPADFQLDSDGALQCSRGAPYHTTSYRYDEARNPIDRTDAEGHRIHTDYDPLARPLSFIQDPRTDDHPDGLNLETLFAYDAAGRISRLTNPDGRMQDYDYDERERITRVIDSLPPNDRGPPWQYNARVEYHYDVENSSLRIDEFTAKTTNSPGSTANRSTQILYDTLGRQSQVSTSWGGKTRTLKYEYYRDGLRKTRQDAENQRTTYTYDGRGQLGTLSGPEGLTRYTYHPDGLLKTVLAPSGLLTTHEYDDADGLRSLRNSFGSNILSYYEFTFDPNRNRSSQIEVNGGVREATTYHYDGLDRLERVDYPADLLYPNGHHVEYIHDKNGNRKTELANDNNGLTLLSIEATFDRVDRLVSVSNHLDPAQDALFEYDRSGNITRQVVGDSVTAFRYDPRNRQTEVTLPDGGEVQFAYDYQGRRTEQSLGAGLQHFLYDETTLLAEYDPDGSPATRYFDGGGRLIGMDSRSEGQRFYSFDGLGSTANLTSSSGDRVSSYHLDSWGRLRFPQELQGSANRFLFTGYRLDDQTGLYHAGARTYDPRYGRFLSQDALHGNPDDPGSLNRYAYGRANPLRYVDPTGNEAGDVWDPRSYDWVVFAQEFDRRFAELAQDLVTVGATAGIRQARAEGRLDGAWSYVEAAALGVAHTTRVIPAAVDAYASGAGIGGVAAGAAYGLVTLLLPIEEAAIMLDSSKNGWERSEAAAAFAFRASLLGRSALKVRENRLARSEALARQEGSQAAPRASRNTKSPWEEPLPDGPMSQMKRANGNYVADSVGTGSSLVQTLAGSRSLLGMSKGRGAIGSGRTPTQLGPSPGSAQRLLTGRPERQLLGPSWFESQRTLPARKVPKLLRAPAEHAEHVLGMNIEHMRNLTHLMREGKVLIVRSNKPISASKRMLYKKYATKSSDTHLKSDAITGEVMVPPLAEMTAKQVAELNQCLRKGYTIADDRALLTPDGRRIVGDYDVLSIFSESGGTWERVIMTDKWIKDLNRWTDPNQQTFWHPANDQYFKPIRVNPDGTTLPIEMGNPGIGTDFLVIRHGSYQTVTVGELAGMYADHGIPWPY